MILLIMVTSQSQGDQDATTQAGWTPSQIEARLGRGGKARIARRAGCHYSAISHLIAGRTKSRRLEGLVAQELRVPREEIFPIRIETPPDAEGVSVA